MHNENVGDTGREFWEYSQEFLIIGIGLGAGDLEAYVILDFVVKDKVSVGNGGIVYG